MKISNISGVFLIVFSIIYPAGAQQQIKGRVETIAKFPPQLEAGKICTALTIGKATAFAQPAYPTAVRAARIGGTVRVDVKLNEKGAFTAISGVSGNDSLKSAATMAARRIKFSPTVCDARNVGVTVAVFYNFIPYAANDIYFKPAKTEDFVDVKKDSQFYEPVLNLTENYRLAFGYSDKKFYADAPLTRGDFAEFLRRTLDLLSERAKNSGKLPREIGLFFPLNTQNLKTVEQIKDLTEKDAYLESVKILLLTYDIALINVSQQLNGKNPLTRAEVVALWTQIFGADAVPVNFVPTGTIDDERILTRGEFALFLQESLGVLTYKVLS